MSNNKSFISGEIYNIEQLFSSNNKIIIPDLQRDYCWGDNSHTEEKKDLVTGFVNDLISHFDKTRRDGNDSLNLGLIYGYEAPQGHIQLCDGQQRITTLFLLIGVLNKKMPNNQLKPYLISDFEYSQDDKEPYLQYSIRETSLYFLSDLVCHYFIHDENNLEYVDCLDNIKNSSWFFNEYHTDPSILSMLKAISKIEEILNNKDEQWHSDFGCYLVGKLTFMYYDMGNRKNGEETFVVINTTGETLSMTQNLKPLIIAENNLYPDISKRWEEIETWFWKNREGDNDTADAGFNEFLRWVTLLYADYNNNNKEEYKKILAKGRYTFPKTTISFEQIYTTFKAVQFLFEEWNEKRSKDWNKPMLLTTYLSPEPNKETDGLKCISQIDCFLLLPLIAYCIKHNVIASDNKGLYRLFHFLKNLTRLTNVAKTVNDLVFDAIHIAKTYVDVVEILDHPDTISNTILTQEEKLKLQIIKEASDREDVESTFWRVQEHNIWDGQIMPIIQWSIKENSFSLDKFKQYENIFNKVFSGECDNNIDIVRRALLTRDLKEYPRIFKGYTNWSFGWQFRDWNVLINDNVDGFKKFLDEFKCDLEVEDVKKVCQNLIDNFISNHSHDISKIKYADFIKYPYLISYCGEKNIQHNSNQDILLLTKKRTSAPFLSIKCAHLRNYLNGKINSNWKIQDGVEGELILLHTATKHKVKIWDDFHEWVIVASSDEPYYNQRLSIDSKEENGELIYPNVLEMLLKEVLVCHNQ